jgi:pyruvate formate lyase activating enzyme
LRKGEPRIMQIAGYLKTSLIEWPGKIASLIFTPGCNFRCPFCHNAKLVNRSTGAQASSFKEEGVFTDLVERKKWIDALVVTGGEPTLQKDLPDFLRKVKEKGFLTMIHTNGTSPEMINGLIINGLTDYFCMDLKNSFEKYNETTGVKVEIEKVKESIKLIVGSGIEHEFRTTVVPGLHDRESLVKLAGQLKSLVHGSRFMVQPKWFLQQFQPKNCYDPKYKKLEPYPEGKLLGFQKELKKIIPGVEVRGT